MTLILILLCYVSSPAERARFQAKCRAWVSLICWGVEWTQKEMERERRCRRDQIKIILWNLYL